MKACNTLHYKKTLQLEERVSSFVWRGTPTSSVIDESAICGRDDEKKELQNYLLSEDATRSDSRIGVISIVGMGGLGKTTLAKLLYNDPEVKEKFDLKAWACISEDFDVLRVSKTLLESVSSEPINTDNLNTLQVKLKQSLSHKRFLLVLDDIWDVIYVDWTNLLSIFDDGAKGSKIIMTTRDERVAQRMHAFHVCHLASLSSDDCWSLLAKHAFGANNCSERSNLEVIGKKIAKKCDGLPLAAVALGGLLRTKSSENEWNKVLKSNIWDLPNVGVQPALLLSYLHLPAPLKPCFAYCSIFPNNSKLEKKMIVQLWIAEGFVHQSKTYREKTMEEVGDEYFDELVSRSLICRRSVDGEANFEMHDLINDLATMVSSSCCIRYNDRKQPQSLERVRHLSYNRGHHESFNKLDTFCELRVLRSFLALPLESRWRGCCLSNKVVHELPAMRKLRVLSLSGYGSISELPNSIANLMHLRYLNLSRTGIERLPGVTCKLYNLQTLLLSYCWCLTELPKDMGKLVNLRHLDIRGTNLKEMPVQIASLQNLQTLSSFTVSKQQDGLKVGELGKFPNLQGELSILNLQNVTDPSDAFQANLKQKKQIEELALEWDYRTTEDPENERLVFEQLQPSTNLKRLTIKYYGGTSFPNWLGDSSFCHMVYFRISYCDHCQSLPPLGQLPCLKELYISHIESVKTVGAEFYGSSSPSFQPFPSLEILEFLRLPEWEEWNLIGGEFPSLTKLSVRDCPKLKGNLPSNLPSLNSLELWDCPLLESPHSDEMDNRNIRRPSDLGRMMLSFNSLQDLTLDGFPSLTSFPRDGLPKTLRSLHLCNCENLEFLPQESLRSYTSLESLDIVNSCCSLTSFPLGLLPILKTLYIWDCKNLKSISITEEDPSRSLPFLQVFSIVRCPELESFPQGGLRTPNLTDFEVSECGKLNSLPEPINTLAGLRDLKIYGLPNLQSFAEEGLPINLWRLGVDSCGRLSTTDLTTKWGLERLSCLSQLDIEGDDLVNAMMKMKVPSLSTSLLFLSISNIHNIKCLDGKWLQHLTLKNLRLNLVPASSRCQKRDCLPLFQY